VALVGLGKPVSEVAVDLEIGTSILYGWIRKGAQPGHLGSGGLRVPQLRMCVNLSIEVRDEVRAALFG
jgi:hypothetical protein